ncbi:MAG: hypothetical protein ACODAB_08035 [Gemmatimonadota bacterium]
MDRRDLWLRPERPPGRVRLLFGRFRVILDERVPPDRVELRDHRGRLAGTITGVGAPAAPSSLGRVE